MCILSSKSFSFREHSGCWTVHYDDVTKGDQSINLLHLLFQQPKCSLDGGLVLVQGI